MDVDGNRELLAWADQSVSQPVLMKAREKPPKVPVQANYSDSVDIFKIRDVYIGAGMKGIDSSTHLAKKIRVVKLQYRIGGGGPVWRCDYGFFTIRRLCTRNFLPGFRIWRFMGCKGSYG